MEEVPFEDRIVPRVEIDWDRSLWWWYPLTRAIHPAVRMTSLLVGLAAVLSLQWGLQWADNWFAPTLDWQWPAAPWGAIGDREWPGSLAAWPAWSINNLAYATFALTWIALTSAVFGGVLARRSAVELGQRTIAPWGSAVRLAIGRLVSYLWVAGMHLVAVLTLLLPIGLLGWSSRWGAVPAAMAGVLLLILSLPLMFAMGRILLGLVLCFPLSVCAISVEKKADAFEGFSRSHAYIFQRPVVAALCILGLVGLGQVGAWLVYWVVQLGWGLIAETFQAASGRSDLVERYLSAGHWLATGLVSAFRYSYFWSATAALYLILRRSVDNTELDEMESLESDLERNPPPIPTTSQPAEAQADDMPASDS